MGTGYTFFALKQVDLWTSDLESVVRVTCDVGYLCANFSLPRPLCSQLRPDVRDKQTDVRRASSLNACALWGRAHNNHCSIDSMGMHAPNTAWTLSLPPIHSQSVTLSVFFTLLSRKLQSVFVTPRGTLRRHTVRQYLPIWFFRHVYRYMHTGFLATAFLTTLTVTDIWN